MSQYSWSKRYQIPTVCFKTEKNSQRLKGFDNKLRQTIDIGSLTNQELNIHQGKKRPLYPQQLRHTTYQVKTLSDLLGKGYKYFEPRANRKKNDVSKKITQSDHNYQIGKRIRPNESFTNATWSEVNFKSLKDFKEIQKQAQTQRFQKQDRPWNSTRIIHSPSYYENLKTLEKPKQPEELQSPYTFIKKNKLFYMTPQTNKNQETDEVSTKFGSPTSCCESSTKFLNLKVVKKQSIKSLQLRDFATIKHLGEGRFGSVSMAIHKKSGFLVAIKRVKKSVIQAHKLQNQFIMEMKMQLFLNHPNILKLYGYFDDSANIYLILQFMEEGTLFNKLRSMKDKHFEQKVASQKIDDILHALKYMHQLEIAHRDIKPENIVMSNGICKLCDFGWAALCENRRTTICGTIDYAAPQVLQGKEYGITMDLWCMGVLCYELLVGKAPFYNVSKKQTIQKIIRADKSELKIPNNLSKEAIDFIENMLIKNPEQRMSAEEAIKHQFIAKHAQKDNQKLRGQHR